MRLATGTILGERYRLEQPLGKGGMGEVWSATNLVTGRAVALKRLIVPHLEQNHDEAHARFLLEARSACAVAHPNVVEVLDFVESPDELPFIVMELLQGETLAQTLSRQSALPLESAAALLLPVVSAVGGAHARGIIHRDLKPSNIFLHRVQGGALWIKVLDFGIAKWLIPERGAAGVRTQTGSALGTPCYMAPEQAMAERTVDHRADIWSIGVILYECLSGVRPVEGDNAAQVVVRLISSGIMPVERLVPDLPPALAGLIGRMLTREPSKRPRDLEEVFLALRELTSIPAPSFSEPPSEIFGAEPAAPAEVSVSAEVVTSAPVAAGSDPTLGRAPEARRRRGLLFAALALAAVLALSVNALLRSPPPLPARSASLQPAAAPVVERSGSEEVPPPPARAEAEPPVKAPAGAPASPSSVSPAAPRTARARRAAPRPRPPPQAPAPRAVTPAAPNAPAEAAPAPLPRGAACERSAACASRLCVAFRCK